MSSRQAVVLASRVLCVYFLYTAFGNLTTLPLLTFNLWRSLPIAHNMPGLSQWGFRSMALSVDAAVLRLAVELVLVVVFYQCGPRVSEFLAGGVMESEASD